MIEVVTLWSFTVQIMLRRKLYAEVLQWATQKMAVVALGFLLLYVGKYQVQHGRNHFSEGLSNDIWISLFSVQSTKMEQDFHGVMSIRLITLAALAALAALATYSRYLSTTNACLRYFLKYAHLFLKYASKIQDAFVH
jgi:hypothetical protein